MISWFKHSYFFINNSILNEKNETFLIYTPNTISKYGGFKNEQNQNIIKNKHVDPYTLIILIEVLHIENIEHFNISLVHIFIDKFFIKKSQHYNSSNKNI